MLHISLDSGPGFFQVLVQCFVAGLDESHSLSFEGVVPCCGLNDCLGAGVCLVALLGSVIVEIWVRVGSCEEKSCCKQADD